MLTHDTTQQAASPDVAPPFPHHAAAPQTPLEAAERQYADPSSAAPQWLPEEGDFA